jgi:hypothetical protein
MPFSYFGQDVQVSGQTKRTIYRTRCEAHRSVRQNNFDSLHKLEKFFNDNLTSQASAKARVVELEKVMAS